MQISYSPGYRNDPRRHRVFPIGKNGMLYDLLRGEGLLDDRNWLEPQPISWSDLEISHDRAYLERLRQLALDPREVRRYGFEVTEPIVTRSRLTVSGTLLACRAALETGLAANLAGGSHHARPDGPAGFCLLNDVSVALRTLLGEGRLDRALVLDLDVHQGDGNALAFRDEPKVFTLSVHGAKNFPRVKIPSDLDVPLPDDTEDGAYLDAVEESTRSVIETLRPELIVYLAGVDPHVEDKLGRLRVSTEGIRAREQFVLGLSRRLAIPLVVLLAGGYGPSVEATVDLHAIVFREAAKLA